MASGRIFSDDHLTNPQMQQKEIRLTYGRYIREHGGYDLVLKGRQGICGQLPAACL